METLYPIEESNFSLTKQFPWRRWSFGLNLPQLKSGDFIYDLPLQLQQPWAWRHLIKTMLTAHSSERASLKAIDMLGRKYSTPEQLSDATWEDVVDILLKSGVKHEGNKAKFIIETSRQLTQQFNSIVPSTKVDLMSFKGVGEHVAQVILSTVFGVQGEFAIDVHVKSISKRLGFLQSDKEKDVKVFHQRINESLDPSLTGHFSRTFVDFGQTICGFSPKCNLCSLTKVCQHFHLQTKSLQPTYANLLS